MYHVYEVYEVGGQNDGQLLKSYDDLRAAQAFAARYEWEHAEDLSPTWGGTMILDEAGALVF